MVDRPAIVFTIRLVGASGNGNSQTGPAPAGRLDVGARNRVDTIIAWLMEHQRELESREKLAITFHCGGKSVVAEVTEKMVLA